MSHPLNASLPVLRAGLLKPTHKVLAHGSRPGETREYFVLPNGQWRRQIGEGHSHEERRARATSRSARIQLEKEQDRLVKSFVESLTGEDREFARATDLAKPLADRMFAAAPAEESPEETNAAADHASGEFGSHNGTALHPRTHPVDTIDPREAAAVDELTPGEVDEAHDAFARGLAWVHEATHLVKKGRRLAVFCALARPDLTCEVTRGLLPSLRAELLRILDREELRLLGLVFGRVFVWCREAADLGAIGVRGDIIAYVIRPELLDAATNAQIGSPTNSTRQAVNKLVCEFRDTFAGIRARTMRGETTRAACRAAQLCGSPAIAVAA